MRRWILICGWLWTTTSGAQEAPGVEVYPAGTIDLRLNRDSGRGLEVNRLRRGDSPFSHIQANLFADLVVGDDLTVFNQLTIDPSARASAGSFLRSWAQWRLYSDSSADLYLQFGKIPTPFGHFTERAYSDKNPLLGHPLMYQYFSSLRANQLPAHNVDLLAHRGSGAGAFDGYEGGGSDSPRSGLPLVYDSCWDYGGGLMGSLWRLEYLFAITQGTLSDPRSDGIDSNDGVQWAARVGLVPFTGALVRLSWARGPYLDEAVESALFAGDEVEDFEQRIVAIAIEYEIRHLIVVAEAVHNLWESPFITDAAGKRDDLEVDGAYVEARYKLGPGLFAAGRWSALRFGRIDDGSGRGQRVRWDRSADRLDLSVGYWVTDGVLAKGGIQLNDLHASTQYDEDDHVIGLNLMVAF